MTYADMQGADSRHDLSFGTFDGDRHDFKMSGVAGVLLSAENYALPVIRYAIAALSKLSSINHLRWIL